MGASGGKVAEVKAAANAAAADAEPKVKPLTGAPWNIRAPMPGHVLINREDNRVEYFFPKSK